MTEKTRRTGSDVEAANAVKKATFELNFARAIAYDSPQKNLAAKETPAHCSGAIKKHPCASRTHSLALGMSGNERCQILRPGGGLKITNNSTLARGSWSNQERALLIARPRPAIFDGRYPMA